MKIRERSHKVAKVGRNAVTVHGDSHKSWLSGVVELPQGYVRVYGYGGTGIRRKVTVFEFILFGRKYVRNFQGKCYSERGCMTKAKEFVADVLAGKLSGKEF